MLRMGGDNSPLKNQNRTRSVQLLVRVTEQEKMLIEKKMALYQTRNFNAYARKMLIDGSVFVVDLAEYQQLANEVNKIGVNINQIAKVVNETKSVTPKQMQSLQNEVKQIWLLLKSSLSALQSASR